MSNETQMITTLAKAISKQMASPVPVSAQYWGIQHIALALAVSEGTARGIVIKSNFPKSINLANKDAKKTMLRWKTTDVQKWISENMG